METKFRPPTRFDIGKFVEARGKESEWDTYTLTGIWHQAAQTRYFIRGGAISYVADHCRVPYTTPDPIAELSAAADWLAERGQDESARVLMAEIENRQQRLRGSQLFTNPPESQP